MQKIIGYCRLHLGLFIVATNDTSDVSSYTAPVFSDVNNNKVTRELSTSKYYVHSEDWYVVCDCFNEAAWHGKTEGFYGG